MKIALFVILNYLKEKLFQNLLLIKNLSNEKRISSKKKIKKESV
jgi:hypothetical protein